MSDDNEDGPRVTPDNPTYRTLVDSLPVQGIAAEDRHLFACLLSVADTEPTPLHQALNLSESMLNSLLLKAFPGVVRQELFAKSGCKSEPPPEINQDILDLLLSFQRSDSCEWIEFVSLVLARIIAVRSAHAGHLWVAMGLFERSQLTAAIGRHLPALLAANDQGMRWKIFLFKQICELNGGTMCKSPVCGDCSDYSFCFAE